MKKFIALTAVSFHERDDDKIYQRQHDIIIDVDNIDFVTDTNYMEYDEFFTYRGSKIFLKENSVKQFEEHIFSLEIENGSISNNCFYVRETCQEIAKRLGII
ncbi:hypothetical protein [Ursidibacter arcticus]